MRYLSLCILFLCLSACGTLPYKEFDSIHKGMDKADVTDLIGSPLHVKQNKQPHVWIYRFYDENKSEIYKEVQFEQGKVVYSGPQITKDKILFPTGSSYTQKDLEDFLKNKKESDVDEAVTPASKKAFQDQATIEEEMLKDLKSKEKFKEIAPATP